MRIGVHIGKIIGGISGSNIVRYDIYGSDVMIANKMESEGKPGFVNVSESVKQILENKTNYKLFEFNKRVEIKKGSRYEKKDLSTNCYFVCFENQDEKLGEKVLNIT